MIISGARHIPPDAVQVQSQMERFINWYAHEGQQLHPIERASIIHVEFVGIHPFIDGNGRTARLLLNFELMKSGYPPIVIQKENRSEYYTALDPHISKDNTMFVSLVAEILERTFDLYLGLI